MEVAGTQLVEKDIENLARGERGRPLRDPTPRETPDAPRAPIAARSLCAFRGSD